MFLGVFGEIGPRKLDKGGCRFKPFFLQMDKSTCELDQPFIETVVVCMPCCEPEFFEDVVSFVEPLAVEAFEITEVVRISAFTAAILDQFCNFCGLLAQFLSLQGLA